MRQYIRDVRTYCRMDRKHTLCKYKDGSQGRCGNKVCARGFTDDAEKNRMVDKHNEFRRELAEGEEKNIEVIKLLMMLQERFLRVIFLVRVSHLQLTWRRLCGMMR